MFEHEPARHALVIGNSEYDHLGPLHSAKLDAERMAARLKQLGFAVTLAHTLPSVREFEDEVLPRFRRRIRSGDLVAFYFSGHGFAYGPDNYIAPADLPLEVTDEMIAEAAIAVGSIEDYFARKSPGFLLVLIDACRAIAGFVIKESTKHAPAKALARRVRATEMVNTVEACAARAGSIALGSNGASSLSPFTKSLTTHIATKGIEVTAMLREVAIDVLLATNQMQRPELVNWSTSNLYLNPSDDIRKREKAEWLAALRPNSRAEVQRFVYRHAMSRYAAAARHWLEDSRGRRKSENGKRKAEPGKRKPESG